MRLPAGGNLPETIVELAQLQQELLTEAGPVRQTDGFPWSTPPVPCIRQKMRRLYQAFLQSHQQWSMVPPAD